MAFIINATPRHLVPMFNINYSIQKSKILSGSGAVPDSKFDCKSDPEWIRIQSFWIRSGISVGNFRLRLALTCISQTGLPYLGIYPKILGIFEPPWDFLGIFYFAKNLRIF